MWTPPARRGAVLAVVIAVLGVGVLAPSAGAQAPTQLRLAAPATCNVNPGCLPPLRSVYKLNPVSLWVRLSDADAGIRALDDGLAEVAVAFTSNPELSRPDVVKLIDDRHMIGADRVVPIMRTPVARRWGRPLTRALDSASKQLTTLQLRALNQQLRDGRDADEIAGEWVDAHGLGDERPTRKGPTLRLAYQTFGENEVLGRIYGYVLQSQGFKVRVRQVSGYGPGLREGVESGKIDLFPGYAWSTWRTLDPRGRLPWRTALKRLGGLTAAAQAPGRDENAFVMKRALASQLGISKISDLAKYWPRWTGS